MKILLTGGAGYIGSHTAVVLVEAGHKVIILDNFCNSHKNVIERLQYIAKNSIPCIEGDVRNVSLLTNILIENKVDAVIHFAGLKAVGESSRKSIDYYSNNVHGLISLLVAMRAANIKNLVFSSSATVYGNPESVPISENFPTGFTNPYAHTKLIGEEIIKSLEDSSDEWRVSTLRYFNPAGAHESGLIGECPFGPPNNLMPFVAQVAAGKRDEVIVFGGDYLTIDGTGVRDYLHVMDLADGHMAALNFLMDGGSHTVNLGTGNGTSVLQVISAYQDACRRNIPYTIQGRRPGDLAEIYADTSLAQELLGWRAKRNLNDMCESSWRWQSLNPNGFSDS